MVFVIVGSIIGASVVLFGLTWLCRRSNLSKKRKSRGKFYTGNWSPTSRNSDFSVDADATDVFGQHRKILNYMRPSPMPSLKPEASDIEAANNTRTAHTGYNYGTNFDLDILAPHKLHTPAVQAATPIGLTLTGSTPNPNGRGWALFDQPLAPLKEASREDEESQSARQSPPLDSDKKLYVVNVSEKDASVKSSSPVVNVEEQAAPARRPTFIQRLLEQPTRATSANLNDRILNSENSHSSRQLPAEQPQMCSLPASRRPSASANTSNGILSAFSSMRILGGSGKRDAGVPEDSDFEGTIGAPDKELPKASRVRKGQRFACDGTSSSEDDASLFGKSPAPIHAAAQVHPNGQGFLWLDGHGTPRTPGLAGVGASWARASAQFARYPDALPYPPQVVMSNNVNGRQLLGAPNMPPPGQHTLGQKGTFAQLKRHQAMIDGAEQQQRRAIPQDGDSRLTSKISNWWSGSWDAEWPSPTLSAAQQFCVVPDEMISPRSTEPSTISSSYFEKLARNVPTPPLESASAGSSSPISTIDWSSEESDAVTLRGEAEIKFWEKQSLARAQADLLRMGSLRPKFAATTTLESWLGALSPVPSPSDNGNADEGRGYEGSIKTPVVIQEEGHSDAEQSNNAGWVTEESGNTLYLEESNHASKRTDSFASQPHSEHPSEASLPSYRTDPQSPQLEEGRGVILCPPTRSMQGKDRGSRAIKRADSDPALAKLNMARQWVDIEKQSQRNKQHRETERRARETRVQERRAARKREERILRLQHAQSYRQSQDAGISEEDWPLDAALRARRVRETQRHRRRQRGIGHHPSSGNRKSSRSHRQVSSAVVKRADSTYTQSSAPSEYETEATSAAAANVLVDYCTPVLRYEAASESSPA